MRDILNSITFLLLKNNIITKDNKAIFEYGTIVIVHSIVIFLSIVFISIIFGNTLLAIISIIIFCGLRGLVGGYHASDFKKCYFMSIGIYFLILLSDVVINVKLKSNLFIILLVLSNIILSIIAPTQNQVNPKSIKIMKKNRNKMFFYLLSVDFFSLLIWRLGLFGELYFIIIFTVMIVAILSIFNYKKGCSYFIIKEKT